PRHRLAKVLALVKHRYDDECLGSRVSRLSRREHRRGLHASPHPSPCEEAHHEHALHEDAGAHPDLSEYWPPLHPVREDQENRNGNGEKATRGLDELVLAKDGGRYRQIAKPEHVEDERERHLP